MITGHQRRTSSPSASSASSPPLSSTSWQRALPLATAAVASHRPGTYWPALRAPTCRASQHKHSATGFSLTHARR